MISDFVYDLCHGTETVSSVLAKETQCTPGEVAQRLFSKHELPRSSSEGPKEYDLERAYECGRWGSTRPSDLFLKIYSDVLSTLDKNHPLAGMCSPPLMGSNGVCPLVVISTVPDICRHMSNLIVNTREEVFLATNYWKHSEGSRLICNALRELSNRAAAEDRRVVVKVMYDRGDLKQVITPHQLVTPKTFADIDGPVRLPHPQEIPKIDLEVVNYHRPPLGTFHSKFAIFDRKIAILQSNNIQDNDNLEMMTQFEGAIVDSLYDSALITWHNLMQPPLPCIENPPTEYTSPTFSQKGFREMFGQDSKLLAEYSFVSEVAAQASRVDLPLHTSGDPHYDEDVAKEVLRAAAGFVPAHGGMLISGINSLLNTTSQDTKPSAPEVVPSQMMTPIVPLPQHDPFPIAMVCREPFAQPTNSSVHTPQNAAFQSALRNATKSVFIQTPNLNAAALLPEILAACRRNVNVTYFYCLGYNDAGELLPNQGGHNEYIANKLYSDLEPEYHGNLDIHCYVAKDQVKPIHNKFKKRSCHIKLMIVDGHIAIQGSGNQDTQSWYHSQEVNVMLDSPLVCNIWLQGIHQNQNTHLYGKVTKVGSEAGCWLDKTGTQADGAIGPDAGRFAWARGIRGAIARLKGTGGF